jgi:hypothetical protein
MIACIVVGFVIAAAIGFASIRAVVGPLRQVSDVLGSVASGDLTTIASAVEEQTTTNEMNRGVSEAATSIARTSRTAWARSRPRLSSPMRALSTPNAHRRNWPACPPRSRRSSRASVSPEHRGRRIDATPLLLLQHRGQPRPHLEAQRGGYGQLVKTGKQEGLLE